MSTPLRMRTPTFKVGDHVLYEEYDDVEEWIIDSIYQYHGVNYYVLYIADEDQDGERHGAVAEAEEMRRV